MKKTLLVLSVVSLVFSFTHVFAGIIELKTSYPGTVTTTYRLMNGDHKTCRENVTIRWQGQANINDISSCSSFSGNSPYIEVKSVALDHNYKAHFAHNLNTCYTRYCPTLIFTPVATHFYHHGGTVACNYICDRAPTEDAYEPKYLHGESDI